MRLRVKDLDFGFKQIDVRDGKGGKDRFTVLPTKLIEPLQKQLLKGEKLHEQDLRRGLGRVKCLLRWQENIRMPKGNGVGNTFFRQKV